MTEEQFNVVQFFPNGDSHYERRGIGAIAAVTFAKELTERPAAVIGITRRIIITDGGDNTVFEWKYGEGVTFPPPQPVSKDDHHPFITVTRGMSGWFAVHMWWNDTREHGLPGFWEPYESGSGRYETEGEAIKEAQEWAELDGLRYLEPTAVP